MLNRTNRTLSANTNRLDLGTRMLGLNASANNGSLTLRTAIDRFPTVVRTGVVEYPGIHGEAPPTEAKPKPVKPAMSAMSGSSSRPMSPARDFRAWDQGQPAMSSQPSQPLGVLRDAGGSSGRVTPLTSPIQGHPRSSLAWHCDRPRRAGRSARAALALVAGATPIS
jgi:hypothetical protein